MDEAHTLDVPAYICDSHQLSDEFVVTGEPFLLLVAAPSFVIHCRLIIL